MTKPRMSTFGGKSQPRYTDWSWCTDRWVSNQLKKKVSGLFGFNVHLGMFLYVIRT